MEHYLITGRAGFIGSNFIHYLLKKYHDCQIVNLDLLTYAGNLANLADIEADPRYRFVQGNINDQKLVEQIIQNNNIDMIVNFAAESHVDRSITDPDIFFETNTKGTLTLLKSAINTKIKKFLQVSTDEVYGALGKTGSFTELSQLDPSSPYSASKASADMFVRAYYKTYGLNVNITRSSNNYGPYQYPEKLIPLMITNAIQGKKLPIYGTGKNVRDWLYVADNCRALDLVLHQGKKGEVYNVGGNNEQTNNEVVQTIINKLDINEPQVEYVSDRPGHDQRYALNYSKITTELGWQPVTNLETGLEKTIKWYLQNAQWWQPLKN